MPASEKPRLRWRRGELCAHRDMYIALIIGAIDIITFRQGASPIADTYERILYARYRWWWLMRSFRRLSHASVSFLVLAAIIYGPIFLEEYRIIGWCFMRAKMRRRLSHRHDARSKIRQGALRFNHFKCLSRAANAWPYRLPLPTTNFILPPTLIIMIEASLSFMYLFLYTWFNRRATRAAFPAKAAAKYIGLSMAGARTVNI